MKALSLFKLASLGVVALGSQAHGQTTGTYDQLSIGSFGYLDWQPITGSARQNLTVGQLLGTLNLNSAYIDSALNAGDGGIKLWGSPVRVLLGGYDGPNYVSNGVFEIWSQGAYNTTGALPAFKVDATTNAAAAFKGLNVTVAKDGSLGGNLAVEGALTVAGRPVVTGAGGTGVALGAAVFTPGSGSFSAGNGKGTGANSTAFGSGTASGSTSFAAGASATASALSSIALGTNANAMGASSVAIGNGAIAHVANSVALGNPANAWGSGSVAASGGTAYDNSTAVSQATTAGYGSFGAGVGTNVSAWSSSVLGSYNALQPGTTSLWVNTDPALIVGNGSAETDRSTAILTLKNGQTTLTNKYWVPASPTAPVTTVGANDGKALVVEGNTELKGKVTLSVAQGDISMGIYAAP